MAQFWSWDCGNGHKHFINVDWIVRALEIPGGYSVLVRVADRGEQEIEVTGDAAQRFRREVLMDGDR